MKEDPQELPIRFIFTTKHNPGTPHHLEEVLRNYLKGKGIELKEDLTIVL